MKICYFGTYEKNYPLNAVIIKGLRKNGIDVKECHIPLWEKHRNKYGSFLNLFSLFKLAFSLLAAYLKLGFVFLGSHRNAEIVIVGYIGQLDVFWLKFLILFLKNKPKTVFIPLVSLYDTAIVDRGLSGEKNVFAKLLFYIDKYSFKLADLVILDTDEHIKYICDLFSLDKNKFKKVWVGADEDVFYSKHPRPFDNSKKPVFYHSHESGSPVNKPNFYLPDSRSGSGMTVIGRSGGRGDKFQVLFFGKYIPLHGLEYIIKAAKLLEEEKDIEFRMIGNGQLYGKITSLSRDLKLKNIEFIKWIGYDKLVEKINKADAVLGIFGGTEKSFRVIPNKVFQAVACEKPVVSGDSPAIRELFTDKENILLCENRNPESLKKAILKLKNDDKLAEKIAGNGYLIFQRELSSIRIGKKILDFIKDN